MANSIALITKTILGALDKVYKQASVTSILDNTALSQESSVANEVKIAKIAMDGLGDYDRNTGYVDGDVTITYETHQFTQDRGRRFTVDAVDNIETAGLAFGALMGEFLRTKVVPEIDAYRIALYHANAGTSLSADITTSTALLTALDVAIGTMDDAEVPKENRVLNISSAMYKLLKASATLDRIVNTSNDKDFNREIEVFEGMRIVRPAKPRFYSAITQYDGSTEGQTAGGYIKNASTGKDLNFQIISPSTIAYQGTKRVVNKIITPEQNQTSDGFVGFYRNYHDTFIYDNKTDGIYSHSVA